MKKIINGKKYDTETAELKGEWYSAYSYRDFHWCSEELYLKKTGEFFLKGEGGPLSKYAESCGNRGWSSGCAIIPLTESEAKEWAEEKLDGNEYEKIFGEVEE